MDMPIELDNRTMTHFEGYRVQHHTSRGPGSGGRARPPGHYPVRDDALSAWISVKTPPSTPPLAAQKGHPRDPKTFSRGELERLTRRCTNEIGVIAGPKKTSQHPM